ncbi:hypothetical protein ACFX15_024583 [Malus domestica]
MASRKEDEKNERIIRGLLKLLKNHRCINCNNLREGVRGNPRCWNVEIEEGSTNSSTAPAALLSDDLLGRGIFNVGGDVWRFQRKMVSLELSSISVS